MKKHTVAMVAAILVIATLSILPTKSWAIDFVEPEGKLWEFSLGVGYLNFDSKELGSTAYVTARVQKRLAYPFLLGVAVKGSYVDDIIYVEAGVPVSIRVPIYKSIKADIVLSPGGAYTKNTDSDVTKILGVGTAGVEVKSFLKKGISLGVGGYFTGCTDSRFNQVNLGMILGF